MTGFLARLKQRKLVQWVLAYLAGAWVLLQVLDLASGSYHWPDVVMHIAFGVLALGFIVVLLLAWYHGERGTQRVSGIELLIIALVLVVGGIWLWRFERAPNSAAPLGAVATVTGSAPAMSVSAAADHAQAAASSTAPRFEAIPAKSIAVLPFENLSTDKGNAYFADGMQDLILTKLADIGDLKVISRTSTLQYGSHPENLKQIGEQLGVATILEGSVQKASNQVLINVQLIDARTDGHIWAQSYQRTLDNIFGVEGEVAGKVAEALKAKLTSSESTRVANVPTTSPVAFDAYLRGEHFSLQVLAGRTALGAREASLRKALSAYRQAVAADPKFALAYAKLAFNQSLLAYFGFDRSDAMRDEALANARRALALQPNLPQAHYALGYVYRLFFADYAKALAEYRLAERGTPNSSSTLAAIAFIQGIHGDTRAEAATLQRATTLDPRNVNAVINLASVAMDTRQWDLARDATRRVEALAPESYLPYSIACAMDLHQHGDIAAALADLARAPATLESAPVLIADRVEAMRLRRDYRAALKIAATLPADQYLLLRADVNALAGHAAAARKLYAQFLSQSPAPPAMLTPAWLGGGSRQGLFGRVEAQAGLGNKAEAYATLRKFIAYARSKGNVAALMDANYALAMLDARFGDARNATDILRQLLGAQGGGLSITVPLLKLDPVWDPIRKDPSFKALLKKHGDPRPVAALSGAAP